MRNKTSKRKLLTKCNIHSAICKKKTEIVFNTFGAHTHTHKNTISLYANSSMIVVHTGAQQKLMRKAKCIYYLTMETIVSKL